MALKAQRVRKTTSRTYGASSRAPHPSQFSGQYSSTARSTSSVRPASLHRWLRSRSCSYPASLGRTSLQSWDYPSQRWRPACSGRYTLCCRTCSQQKSGLSTRCRSEKDSRIIRKASVCSSSWLLACFRHACSGSG